MENISKKNKHWYWTQKLSVGISEIDNDHKIIFQLINETYLHSQKDSDSANLYRLVSELVDYTESHFIREEAIIAASAYPYCENQFTIHKELIKQIKQPFFLVKAGQQSSTNFVMFLKDWFIEHIEGTDQQISSYIAEHEEKYC